MKKIIYIIEYSDLDGSCTIGYCTTLKRAKEVVDKLNAKIERPVSDELIKQFEDISFDWEDIQSDMEDKLLQNCPYHDETVVPHITDSVKWNGYWQNHAQEITNARDAYFLSRNPAFTHEVVENILRWQENQQSTSTYYYHKIEQL